MPSPLRSTVSALLVATALVLGGCGSSPSSARTPTHDAGSSISQGARQPDARLSVVGVARGDRLNLRAKPSPHATVLRRLSPLAQGLEPIGDIRHYGSAPWQQVRVGTQVGWVNARYVGYLGRATSQAGKVASLDIGATRVDVAVKAARRLGLGAHPVLLKVRHPVVVLDDLQGQDDSMLGTRLRLVLAYGEAGFQVKQADTRPICARGLTPQGQCL